MSFQLDFPAVIRAIMHPDARYALLQDNHKYILTFETMYKIHAFYQEKLDILTSKEYDPPDEELVDEWMQYADRAIKIAQSRLEQDNKKYVVLDQFLDLRFEGSYEYFILGYMQDTSVPDAPRWLNVRTITKN